MRVQKAEDTEVCSAGADRPSPGTERDCLEGEGHTTSLPVYKILGLRLLLAVLFPNVLKEELLVNWQTGACPTQLFTQE